MKTVTARLIPAVDLNIKFAVENDDGTIRQYYASTVFLKTKYPEQNPEDAAFELLKAQLKDTMGQVEVILDRQAVPAGTPVTNAKAIPEHYFSSQVLKDMRRVTTPAMLYQFNYELNQNIPKWIQAIYNNTLALAYKLVARGYNRLVDLYYKDNVTALLVADKSENLFELEGTMANRFAYLDLMSKISEKYIRTDISLGNYIRRVEPVRFLTIVAGEDDLERAIETLSLDLEILSSENMIMGNLSMPGIVELTNTVGNNKKIYAVFAYVILDTYTFIKNHKLDLVTTISNEANFLKTLSEKLDIHSFTLEGGLSYLDGKAPYSDLVVSSEALLAQRKHGENQVTELERLYKQQQEDTAKAYQALRERQGKLKLGTSQDDHDED